MPLLLVPSEPGDPRHPDPVFAREAEAARSLGLQVAFLDHDVLEATHDGHAALRRSRLPEPPATSLYRGWMMQAAAYAGLTEALAGRGFTPLTDADSYRRAHHGPCMAQHIAPWAARSVSVPIERLTPTALTEALAVFGTAPVVVKDWVKSQAAGHWNDACYISCAADTDAALRVIARFIELQSKFLVGGVVLRAYHALLGADGRTAQGNAVEWRSFVVGGMPVETFCRDPRGADLAGPGGALLSQVAQVVPSPFFAMDWGARADGGFLLLEVGDGGVSGIPDHVSPVNVLSCLQRMAQR